MPVSQLFNTLIPIPPATTYVALGSISLFAALFSMAFYYAVVKRPLPRTSRRLERRLELANIEEIMYTCRIDIFSVYMVVPISTYGE